MAVRETAEQALARWNELELLQQHYKDFDDFLTDVMEDVMGFTCTDIQHDIGKWVAYGPQYRMVQAQRGEAKTTITAIFAVWKLIQDPTTRILIISAGEDMAVEIGNWIIQIINNMDELACLRPDRSNGDRSSVEAFDVHYSLKGPEKSPSVRSMGITANLQGKRADVLIADDVESQKNSATQVQRDRLKLLTYDFTSICSHGEIIWLGTPQSIDSVYNSLPQRGTAIRIWPGRYPTQDEEAAYGAFLAPLLKRNMELDPSLRTGGGPVGDSGQPSDPQLFDDDTLTQKEISQTSAYFQLQHMLNTKLSDEQRYPIKISNLRILDWDREQTTAPMHVEFTKHMLAIMQNPAQAAWTDPLYRVQNATDFGAVSGLHMYVDPAGGGQNADEVAIAITGMCAGRVFLYDVDGMIGGIDDKTMDWLTAKVLQWPNIKHISIEENYGNGALSKVWQPRLLKALAEAKRSGVGIEDVWEAGQKELRIIDVLEPVVNTGKLVVHESLLEADVRRTSSYAAASRTTYSWFFQMSRITRDKNALIHDDTLDAISGSVRYWVDALAIDDEKAQAAAKNAAYRQLMKNPLGDGRPMPKSFSTTAFGMQTPSAPNALAHTQYRPGMHRAAGKSMNRH